MNLFKTRARGAIMMLKQDHERVKDLFKRFEKADEAGDEQKCKAIADKALQELRVHATVEEELFYPAVRQQIDDEDGIMDEADEEHHAAKVLIAELELMSGSEEHYRAKFLVLAEMVQHHIKEEEGLMFREAAGTEIDFEALGERMAARKAELESDGVPPDAESRMVRKAGLRGDSPARAALKTILVPMVEESPRRRSKKRRH